MLHQKFSKKINLLLLLLFVASCSGGKVVFNPAESNQKGKNITIAVEWLKNKGDKFDANLRIINNTNNPLIVMSNNVRCFRGETEGIMKYSFFNVGERIINIPAGSSKGFDYSFLVCKFHKSINEGLDCGRFTGVDVAKG